MGEFRVETKIMSGEHEEGIFENGVSVSGRSVCCRRTTKKESMRCVFVQQRTRPPRLGETENLTTREFKGKKESM